jgi:uncharacterized membrane protein
MAKKITIPELLTIITIVDLIWGSGGLALCLWVGYGIYKLFTND